MKFHLLLDDYIYQFIQENQFLQLTEIKLERIDVTRWQLLYR